MNHFLQQLKYYGLLLIIVALLGSQAIDHVQAMTTRHNVEQGIKAAPNPPRTPTPTRTAIPTNTPRIVPTNTSVPTDTPVPTNTPVPTDTPKVVPTDTPTLLNTPTLIPTFTPIPVVPILQVNPTNLVFNAIQGSNTNPGSQLFAISNGSSGLLNWTVNENKTWLSVDTLSGSNGDVISVLPDVNGLVIGVYNGQITIIAIGATSSPIVINVTLNVVEFAATATHSPTLQPTDSPTVRATNTLIAPKMIYLPILIKSPPQPTPTPTLTPTPLPTPIDLYVETKNTGGVNLSMYDKNSNTLLLTCTLPNERQSNTFEKTFCGQFLKKEQLYRFEAMTNKCGLLQFEVLIDQIVDDNTIRTWCN